MMWIFEWDIVTGDTAALDSIYAVSRRPARRGDRRGRRRRSTLADAMRTLVAGTDPATWRDPALRADVRRHARLRGQPVRHARRVPDHGPAARAVARHRLGDGERRSGRPPRPRYRHGPRRARRGATAATSTCRPTTSPRPTSASSAPTATGHGLARPGPAGAAGDRARCSARPGQRLLRGRPRRRRALRALWLGATRPWRVGAVCTARRPDSTGCWSGRSRRVALVASRPSTPGSPRRRTWS